MGSNAARRTKIVCTIGPSSNSPEVLKRMIQAGMNVARLNFSHGTHEYHQNTCDTIRRVADELDANIGILVDLQGPKIRTGTLIDGKDILLNEGDDICLTTRDIEGTQKLVSTTYQGLPNDVSPGARIFLADGTLEFSVEKVDGTDVHCKVIHGGLLGERKGINLPGVEVSASTLTEKDLKDVEFAMTMDIDFVALSFVRSAADVHELRGYIDAYGKEVSIIAKIERPEAIKNFLEILDASDIIMLARGDLGVEVPLNELPQIQKKLIFQCNNLGIPVITATQMLESMTTSARPTRAEVADVANAIYDGTDALMLSGETASGQYPDHTVQIMADIATNADAALTASPTYDRIVRMRQSGIRKGQGSFADAIGQAACRCADAIEASRIVCFTKRGYTAALIARYRPNVPLTAITLNEFARRRCSIIWGVQAIAPIEAFETEELDPLVDKVLLVHRIAKPGDIVVLAGGFPLSVRTRTNMMKLHTVTVAGTAGSSTDAR